MEIPSNILRDKCVIYRRSEGSYGPVFGPGVETACSAEEGARKITNEQGEDIVASGMLIMPPSANISAGDRVEFNGRVYEAVRVDSPRPAGKAHHLEVYVQSAS